MLFGKSNLKLIATSVHTIVIFTAMITKISASAGPNARSKQHVYTCRRRGAENEEKNKI